MNLQYFHDIPVSAKGGTTDCVDVPDAEEFLALVHNELLSGDNINLEVGVAYCNETDFYNKKIGRQLSSERLDLILFTFHTIRRRDDGIYVTLHNGYGYFVFKLRENNSKVWLVNVY